MSDHYNTSELQDKQTLTIINTISGGQPQKKENKSSGNIADLYERGISHFKSREILLELDKNGDHCGHNIWILSRPTPIKGVNYDPDFFIYRPLYTNDDFRALLSAYSSMVDELKEFWEPLVYPKPRDNNLALYTDRLNQMAKIQSRYTVSETFRDFQTHDPSKKGIFKKLAVGAKTWIPSMDWFDDSLKSLTFDDIFVLLPPAERNIMKLWLGKSLLK